MGVVDFKQMIEQAVGFDSLFWTECEELLNATTEQKLSFFVSFWLLFTMSEELNLLRELVYFVLLDQLDVLIDSFREFLFVDDSSRLWLHSL